MTHKLMYIPATNEWNLFDLENDSGQMLGVSANPEYAKVREELTAEDYRLRKPHDTPPAAGNQP